MATIRTGTPSIAGQTVNPNRVHESGTNETNHNGNETLQDEPSQEEWDEIEAGDRRHESDAMLALAYRGLAEASRDMAIWSQATAVALEEKLAAARREYDAARQVVQATERYHQAVHHIEEAMAHRRVNTGSVQE